MKKIFNGCFLGLLFASSICAQCELYADQSTCYEFDECEGEFCFWTEAEYLFWKIKDSPESVPLVATVPVIVNGGPVIGEPGASVVLGGRKIQNNWRSGGRFAAGFICLDEDQYFSGADVSYFFLPTESKKHSVFSSGLPGSPYLSVPYFNTLTASESSTPVAAPGLYQGDADLKVANSMQGVEVYSWNTLVTGDMFAFNWGLGFRYWNFDEHLTLCVNSPALNVPGEIYKVKDQFHAENNFYGGQIGVGTNWSYQGFIFKAKGTIALGSMKEELTIKGKFVTNNFNGIGAPQTFSGGYFALPSNIGHHKRSCFAILPEVNLNVSYFVSDSWLLKAGYSFLYVNKVLSAGKQINRNINPSQSSLYEFTATPTLIGEASPKASLKNESFWAQGLNVGVEFNF